MTTRVLDVDEYDLLIGTEADAILPLLTDDSRVVVVEHQGQVVGCHVLQRCLHAECLWIHPDHRGKASVARRLWAGVQREVREHFGARAFLTAAVSDDVRHLLEHVGATRVEADQYVVPVKGV